MEIYADNAATTKMSRIAAEAMINCMETVYGNPSSPHTFGQKAWQALNGARQKIAVLLGCRPGEITFTSGGTESDNQAIRTAAAIGARIGKKHILTTAFEHHAVLHTLRALGKEGFEVTLLEVGEDGIIKPEHVSEAIRPDTCLVTVMYANNEIGTIQPVSEIGEICCSRGILFHTDAVQAAGHLPIWLKQQHIDLLSLSSHKFHGPKGVGILYCREGIPLENVIYGGAQEKGKRPGTENLPGIVSMAAALEESIGSLETNSAVVLKMRNRLIHGLSQIPGAVLNGDPERRLPGNVNFCFEGIEGESLLMMLDMHGIAASSGSACTAGSLDPSHVLLSIGRSRELAKSSLRLTIDEQNTDQEIETIIAEVTNAVQSLKNMHIH
ncbi:MAG: cysteine desulfurase [Anaerolineaceae bacterium]|nr:cysteine desulfurase [Anaerolineaceae bacterium]